MTWETPLSGRSLDHTVHAFELIEELDRLATPQAIIDAMERSFAQFGFESFIMTGLPHPEQRIESLVLLKKWPLGWYERYTRNSYDRHDPVIRLCRRTVQPFEWVKPATIPRRTPKARKSCTGLPISACGRATACPFMD
jgi:LuxR family quorum sensing-dependent transcriptional regulator|nr:autoinducer binding domain-containing protein [Microvirga arabica]